MGTCIDHAFRFGGPDEAKTNAAIACIRQVQAETSEHSGNGVCDFSDEPLDDGEFKKWFCYCKSGDETIAPLREKLISLTEGGGFEFWYYWECTDGCNESSVEHHRDGGCIVDLFWGNGVLGLDASIAAAALEHQGDPHSALLLIAALSDAEFEAEDDFAPLENSHTAAMTLVDAFRQWPALLANAAIRSKFDDMVTGLSSLLANVKEHFQPDEQTEEDVLELQGLLAMLERELLKQAASPTEANAGSGFGRRL